MADENMLIEDGYAVGRLISLALKSAKPARDGEYKQLLDQYIYEEPFAAAVDQVLSGMGLRVLNENTSSLRGGLVLGCEGFSSPFAPNVESHARAFGREQRMALGVIHLAIMSFFYPVVEDDDEDDFRSRSGTPSEIGADIRHVCETLRQQTREEQDYGGIAPAQMSQAYEYFLSLPPAPAKSSNFLPRSTQVGLVNYTLQELTRNGFLAIDGGEGANTRFVSLPKYRLYVRRLASHAIARLIRAARQNMLNSEEGETAHV